MLKYAHSEQSDPFFDIYSHPEWLRDYDPPRDFPFWVNVEPTNLCNLDCIFCSRQLNRKGPKGLMADETLDRIVDEVAAHRPAAMRMAGWGEPMLHPRFVDQVRRIKRAGVRLKIYTNGILLTEDIMAALVDAGLDELQFSMQGLNQDQYEFNRRKSDYGRLAANIGMAREVRDRMGGDRPFLSLLTSALKSELEAEDPQRFLDHWTRVVDKAAVDLTNLNFVRHLDHVRDLLDDQALNMVHRRCVDVFLALEVNFNGAIEFCGQDACQTSDHVIGFVDRMSLHQAWHSDRMNAHRQAVGREVRHDQLPICRNCYHNTDKYALFKSKYSAAD